MTVIIIMISYIHIYMILSTMPTIDAVRHSASNAAWRYRSTQTSRKKNKQTNNGDEDDAHHFANLYWKMIS